MVIDVNINGEAVLLEIEPDELLATALRRIGYQGLKRGCQDGSCGACTVLLDGMAVRSCLLFAVMVDGHEVTTIEGLGTPSTPHPIQQAFVDHGAVQCGYCIPGMVLSAKALLDENPWPSPREISEALDGNLCRCTGYVKQIEAVLDARERLADEQEEP
jgi:aerobic-type carbon monoxide dehydrogenase small subunit (CoxS/CutS family)